MTGHKVFILILCLALGACSIPRIVVLSDTLTARENNDLGVSYEMMGEYDLALKQYQLAFEKDRNWDQPLINHGNVHAGLENWNMAESSYLDALNRNPDNPEAMNNLAHVLMKQEKNTEALDWSGRAVEYLPENPAILNTHAWALLKTDSPCQARKVFLKALEFSPDEGPLLERINEGIGIIESDDDKLETDR